MTDILRVAVRRFGPFETAIARQFDSFVRASGREASIEIEAMDLNPLHAALFDRREMLTPRWDIAFLSTDWLAEAHELGLLEELQPWLDLHPVPEFPEGWSPSLLNLQRFSGGFWGMPYHDGPQCLIYRKDLLAGAGITVPRTWAAFHQAARRLHDPGHGRYGTVLALFPDGHNSFYDFCIQVWTRGGEPFDTEQRPALRGRAAMEALDFLRTLARDAAAVHPNPRGIDSVRSGQLFCEGRIGLMTNWFGFAAHGETAPDSQVRGRIGIAPLPAGPGGESVSLNVFWVLSIAAGSGRKPLAWEFLRHCASAPMDRLTMLEGAIGVRLSTWADPQVNAAVPYAHTLAELHRHARQMPLHPRLSAVAHVVDEMIAAALCTNAPSADLLDAAQAKLGAIA